MGVVYRVEHLHLGKTAAMKVLTPDTAEKPEMVRRFRLEAQSVSKLNHPNIVQTFDFGQFDGAFYLVMEFIKGEDLAALLKREGPWSFQRAARLFVQVCSGLTEAHDAGIIHRDLKPENLMVVHRREGVEHAKVLDFGLAKLRERAEARAISTGGQVIGTPYYMAPEQVRGERARRARGHLQPGRDAVSRAHRRAAVRRAVADERAVEAPHRRRRPAAQPRARLALPAEADRIVLRAMAKSVEDRYASAAEVQQDLERALAAPSRDVRAAPPSRGARPARRARPAQAPRRCRRPQRLGCRRDPSEPTVARRLRRADVRRLRVVAAAAAAC